MHYVHNIQAVEYYTIPNSMIKEKQGFNYNTVRKQTTLAFCLGFINFSKINLCSPVRNPQHTAVKVALFWPVLTTTTTREKKLLYSTVYR